MKKNLGSQGSSRLGVQGTSAETPNKSEDYLPEGCILWMVLALKTPPDVMPRCSPFPEVTPRSTAQGVPASLRRRHLKVEKALGTSKGRASTPPLFGLFERTAAFTKQTQQIGADEPPWQSSGSVGQIFENGELTTTQRHTDGSGFLRIHT